jgi:phenylalanyl-tRNA synthetase beta chain
MKASLRWLRELCPQLPDDANTIAARLTGAGVEVEAMHAYGLGAEACLVASVVRARPHPSRAGLRLVTVDRGGAEQEVVCGAANVPEPGGLVVLAPLGAHLPAKGMTIERRAIAGVTSEGMLCSEEELGLTDDGDGILVLPPGTATPGTPLVSVLPAARDTVFEIGLTPNRPDCLGHIGVAREAAALLGVPFAAPAPTLPSPLRDDPLSSFISVSIEDPERCAHYGAAVLLDTRIGPSPLHLRWRLASLGVRPISNVVDVTNLVMLEYGHPIHAFDLDRVRGRAIVVRRARPGEKLRTLDGVDRALDPDDLVICDGEGPVALAGVMGGGESEITAETHRVLVECAYFDPRAIRRAARRHGLHTESSHRFERGVDWGDTPAVLARTSGMIAELAGASAVKEQRVFEARALARTTVPLRHARLVGLLGVDVPEDEARGILGRLGFLARAGKASAEAWEAPSFRPDVSREVDLIEEVARVRGFDAIPATLPPVRASRDEAPVGGLARRAREAGAAMGLSEAITYAFLSPRELEAVRAPAASVLLRNPMSEAQSVMRTSLLPGLLRAASHARRHGERDARLFSVGAVFLASNGPMPDGTLAGVDHAATRAADAPASSPPRGPVDERLSFAALLAGDRPAWLHKPEAVDVWDGKGIAESLVARLLRREADVRLAPEKDRPAHLHPRGAAWIEVAGKRVGSLGPLHPDVLDAFDLADAGSIVVVEVDLAALAAIGVAPVRFVPLPRFPASTRDLAVVVADAVPAGDVERAVREAAGDLAEEVSLFDRFVGGSVPAGHASLALHVVYRAADRTLTDAEVDQRHAQVVAEVGKRFGAQLRA